MKGYEDSGITAGAVFSARRTPPAHLLAALPRRTAMQKKLPLTFLIAITAALSAVGVP